VEENVNWQYRTILFEYQKDGLLGDKYIDDEEMEKVLNEQGELGWELVSVTSVQEGLLAFFKQVLLPAGKRQAVPAAVEPVRQAAPPSQPSPGRQVERSKEPERTEKEPEIRPPAKKTDVIGRIRIS